MNFYLNIRISLLNPSYERFCHFFGSFFTNQNSNDFISTRQHLREESLTCFDQPFFGRYDFGVCNSNVMTLCNFQIVKYCISNGISDLSGFDMLNSIQHIVCIYFYTLVFLESKRCRDTLRNTLARNNGYAALTFKKVTCLLCSKYDIRVIWQNENVLS
ncbi:hypothetical protein D3C73_1293490 [compost metagenome]